MKHSIILSLLILMILKPEVSAQDVINIWPDLAPGSENIKNKEKWEGEKSVRNVYQPNLTVFLPEKNIEPTAAVLVFPGGGYRQVVMEKEGYKIARWFNEQGVAAFVLKYRLNPNEAHQDAQRAMRVIRSDAEKYNINPDKVGIIGFSAGGNLGGLLIQNNQEFESIDNIDTTSFMPDFFIGIYGAFGYRVMENGKMVFKPLEVHKAMPPVFLVHAANDSKVSSKSSIDFYLDLLEKGVPAELHVYEKGEHGFALEKDRGAEVTSTVEDWSKRCIEWLKLHGIL